LLRIGTRMNVPVCNRNLCLALPSGGGSDRFVHGYFVKRRKIIWCEGLYIYFGVSSWGVSFLLEGGKHQIYTVTWLKLFSYIYIYIYIYIFDVEKSLQGDHFVYLPLLGKFRIVQSYSPHGSIKSLTSLANMVQINCLHSSKFEP
jgi:hypothetical protein